MNRIKKLHIVLILLFAILLSAPVGALEVSGMFHTGNLSFDKESIVQEASLSGTKFPYGFSLYASQQINDALNLKAGVFYDPILRYITYTLFEYRQDYITLGVGPFFGTLNTPGSILQSGISTEVTAQIPGMVYAKLRSDSSIGARFTKNGDYLQERNDLSIGYYIPNAICSLNMLSKSFVTRKTASLEIDDTLVEYSFKVDIYQKNVPFQILLSFGYQQLTRSYIDTTASTTTANTLNSIILGTKFTFRLSDALKIIADLDSNVYSFGTGKDGALGLPGGLPEAYLFRSAVGFSWTF
jgi:hypothetical protein